MANVGDIYEITASYTTLGIAWQNVYHYMVETEETGTADSTDLHGLWASNLNPELDDILSVSTTATNVTVINLNDPTDFSIVTPVFSGNQVGEVINPFFVMAFKYHRTIVGRRSGRKAYSGVVEGAVANGAPTPTFLVALNEVAARLQADLTAAGVTFVPGVLRSGLLVPPTPADFMEVNAVSFERFSTQNSRKS